MQQGKRKFSINIQYAMAEYEMQEMTLPNEDGKRILYPRMRLWGQADLEYIAENITRASSFTKGDILGLVEELTKEIAYQMGQGKSVKIDGLGIFTPSLGLREGRERESGEKGDSKRNAVSICLRSVNFRADKKFIGETARHCTLERATYKFRRSSQKYTPEERLKRLQEYLREHPFINVASYCQLTGLLRDSAARELKNWAMQPDSEIGIIGRGTHKLYIKKTSPLE